jgi:hypothetical protein
LLTLGLFAAGMFCSRSESEPGCPQPSAAELRAALTELEADISKLKAEAAESTGDSDRWRALQQTGEIAQGVLHISVKVEKDERSGAKDVVVSQTYSYLGGQHRGHLTNEHKLIPLADDGQEREFSAANKKPILVGPSTLRDRIFTMLKPRVEKALREHPPLGLMPFNDAELDNVDEEIGKIVVLIRECEPAARMRGRQPEFDTAPLDAFLKERDDPVARFRQEQDAFDALKADPEFGKIVSKMADALDCDEVARPSGSESFEALTERLRETLRSSPPLRVIKSSVHQWLDQYDSAPLPNILGEGRRFPLNMSIEEILDARADREFRQTIVLMQESRQQQSRNIKPLKRLQEKWAEDEAKRKEPGLLAEARRKETQAKQDQEVETATRQFQELQGQPVYVLYLPSDPAFHLTLGNKGSRYEMQELQAIAAKQLDAEVPKREKHAVDTATRLTELQLEKQQLEREERLGQWALLLFGGAVIGLVISIALTFRLIAKIKKSAVLHG